MVGIAIPIGSGEVGVTSESTDQPKHDHIQPRIFIVNPGIGHVLNPGHGTQVFQKPIMQTDMMGKLHRPAQVFVTILIFADEREGRPRPDLERTFAAGTAENEFKSQRTDQTGIAPSFENADRGGDIRIDLQGIAREQMGYNAAMNTQMTERFNVSGAMLVKLFGTLDREQSQFDVRAHAVRDACRPPRCRGSWHRTRGINP